MPDAKTWKARISAKVAAGGYRPMKANSLARRLGAEGGESAAFKNAITALLREGTLEMGPRNTLRAPRRKKEPGGLAGKDPSLVVGVFRPARGGFGFVVPDEPQPYGDLFIPARDTGDALDGDKVECTVSRRGKRGEEMRCAGRIVRIVERADQRIAGALHQEGSSWWVEPEGGSYRERVTIGDPGAKGAKAGDQVVVELTQYPTEGVLARGVITERLGKSGTPDTDRLTVLRQAGIPDRFPRRVMTECRALARNLDWERAAEGRDDLSGELIITIDPDDARDYDDAISLRKSRGKSKAKWELGVHIADVSSFVKPGSALDDEAMARGTSVYLPGHVVPMLPEILSNELCSLQEGEPRLTKSAYITYDSEGRVLKTRFANSLIRSTRRLTYDEVTKVLETPDASDLPRDIKKQIADMGQLARSIRQRRLNAGMLVLHLPDVDLHLDEESMVIGAEPEDTSFSHTVIEMFMVEANEAVARLFDGLRIPCLRRIHPPPEEESLANLGRFLRLTGAPLAKQITVKSLQKLIHRVEGRPEAYAVNLAVLKSLQLAEYSPKGIGHFALASDHYLHFTSPIRRYPDLMVHRLLQAHLDGDLADGGRRTPALIDAKKLVETGKEMSYLSRRAEKAERELSTLKILRRLADSVGDTYVGVITHIAGFALFVQHPLFLIEGAVRVEDLGDDTWDVDVGRGRVAGKRTRREFRLGREVEVRMIAVDIPSRRLELSLVEAERARDGRKRKARPKREKREKAEKSGKRGASQTPRKRTPARTSGKKGRGR